MRALLPFAALGAFLLSGAAFHRYNLPTETETMSGPDLDYKPKGSFRDYPFEAELECESSYGPCSVDVTYLYEVKLPPDGLFTQTETIDMRWGEPYYPK